MKQNKLLILCLTLIAVLFALTGCGLPDEQNATKPQRILSMNLDADEILLDIVEPERIIAISELVDNPDVSYSVEKAKTVEKRVRAYNLEEILSFQPDLVIVSEWMDASLKQSIQDMGIRIHTYETAETLEAIPAVIQGIADAVEEREKGEALIRDYEKKLDAVLHVAQKIPAEERVSLFLWAYQHPFGAGDTLFGDMCRKIGVKNVLDDFTRNELGGLTQEFLITANPDVIMLTNWQFEGETVDKMKARFAEDPAYSTVTAVRNDHFVSIPGRAIYCPNHYAADGLREIFNAIYPEYATEIEEK